ALGSGLVAGDVDGHLKGCDLSLNLGNVVCDILGKDGVHGHLNGCGLGDAFRRKRDTGRVGGDVSGPCMSVGGPCMSVDGPCMSVGGPCMLVLTSMGDGLSFGLSLNLGGVVCLSLSLTALGRVTVDV
ncbi:unnamed protein product, partial [Meganyctiphanes norvegica]